MEQENTDFDFIEEYRHDVSDRVKALQAAYDQDGAVKRLNVSEKEVGASPLPKDACNAMTLSMTR